MLTFHFSKTDARHCRDCHTYKKVLKEISSFKRTTSDL